MSTKRGGNYSPNMRMPGSTRPRPNRAIFTLVMCLLVPPVGLVLMWRLGVFRTRGRMLVTALATVEMAVIAILMMPAVTLEGAVPVPGTPARVTPAPSSDVLTALSNMEQIILEQQGGNASTTQGPSILEQLQAEESQRNEILNTIVYCVYDTGVRYYHAAPVCGNQSNRRELTVQQAMSEGLGACPDCNPPVYGFITATQAPEED